MLVRRDPGRWNRGSVLAAPCRYSVVESDAPLTVPTSGLGARLCRSTPRMLLGQSVSQSASVTGGLLRALTVQLATVLLLAGYTGPVQAEPPSTGSVLTVGAGRQFRTIGAAVAASRDGDVVEVDAGTYTDDFAEVNTRITLRGIGGMVHVVAISPPPNGRAAFTVYADATFDGFEVSGVQVPNLNGAAVWHQRGRLTLLNSYFHDNQMGVLTNYDRTSTLTIRNCEFAGNIASGSTSETGLTHNFYAGGIARLTVENSYFHDATLGHQLKSRALETIVVNSRFADFAGTASYSIDMPNGGRAVLVGNTIEQGPNSDNPVIIAFGEEGASNGGQHPDSRLEMRGNTVVNRLPGGLMLWNASGAPATVSDTKVFGLPTALLVSGPATVTGTKHLSAAPLHDPSHPWEAGARAPQARNPADGHPSTEREP